MIARLCVLAALSLVMALPGTGFAQTLRERIDAVRLERAASASRVAAVPTGPTLETLLNRRMSVSFTGQTFDDALRIWSRDAGVTLLINRPAWDRVGVDRSASVTLQLDEVPAAQALLVLLDVGSDVHEFVAQPSPGSRPGLEILTKQEANRAAFVRVYDVQDLVMEVPNFTDAPSMNLGDALGGSSSSGGGDLFEDPENDDEPTTLQERGDALAETIRQSVEPGVWRANGGQFAAVRFRDGRLIVRAPGYVHAQIAGGTLDGRPGHATSRPAGLAGASSQGAAAGSASTSGGTSASNDGVASVAPTQSPDVAGVAE
ncbi:MAG: hypothetical protein AAF328_04080 [Planctomycetota bacterium]